VLSGGDGQGGTCHGGGVWREQDLVVLSLLPGYFIGEETGGAREADPAGCSFLLFILATGGPEHHWLAPKAPGGSGIARLGSQYFLFPKIVRPYQDWF
jgi:hypothetical protein